MTLTVPAAITDAMEAHLEAFGSPTPGIAFPDKPFEPVDGEFYLEVQHFPNDTRSGGVADDSQKEYRGFMQVSVMWPGGIGQRDAIDMAGQVARHFTKGTKLQGDGVQVRIEREPWASPPMTEPDRVRVPVTIQYRVFHV